MIPPKIVVVLLLVSCAAPARNATKLVEEVCKAGDALPYDDCVEALSKDLRTKTITDIQALTFLSLDLALANSSEVVGYVEGLLENAPTAQKPVITSCLGDLKGSHVEFSAAIGDLLAGEARLANYDCFVATDGPYFCREAMKRAHVSIPGISTRSGWVEFFARLCYTTTNMVHGKEQKH